MVRKTPAVISSSVLPSKVILKASGYKGGGGYYLLYISPGPDLVNFLLLRLCVLKI